MKIAALLTSILVATTLFGCGMPRSDQPTERYISSQVKGESQKINLDEVKKAFWETKGKDFSDWMSAFEKRVNEIYEGKDVVSLDASRKAEKMTITGYIENQKEPGYQDGEEKLFTIEQTGDVTDNQLPYRMTGHDGREYYAGHHSILDNPFVQMMVLSHLMGGWGGRYYTPYHQTTILRDQRDSFRNSSGYTAQKSANQDFNSRFKKKQYGDGFASRKGFGTSSYTSTGGTTRRSWDGFSNSTSPSASRPSWGGRRSPGGVFGGGRSRGWGGMRRGR